MSDAPERIWIDVMAIFDGVPRWRYGDWTANKADLEGETNLPEPLEYVRADLSVAEAARVLLEARNEAKQVPVGTLKTPQQVALMKFIETALRALAKETNDD